MKQTRFTESQIVATAPAPRSSATGRWSNRSGSPAYVERFKGTFRREVLDAHIFTSIRQVRRIVGEWLMEYNTERPHQGLKFMMPVEYRQAA